MYKYALEILKALPEDKQFLIDGRYYDEKTGENCAIGAILNLKKDYEDTSVGELPQELQDQLAAKGITIWEARHIQSINDQRCDPEEITSKERYNSVMFFLENKKEE